MKFKSLITIAILSVILYFFGLYTDNHLLRMVTKPLPLIAMMVLLRPVTFYSKFVFIALLFSVIGDLLLEFNTSMFVFGLIAFLLAHIAYTTAFLKRSRKLMAIPFVLLMGYGAVVYWLLYPGLGKMALPVLIYIVVILIMSWRSMAQNDYDKKAVFAVAGSLLFVVSDSLIAFNKFYVEIQYAHYLIMISYWAAQGLLFYSAFADDKKDFV